MLVMKGVRKGSTTTSHVDCLCSASSSSSSSSYYYYYYYHHHHSEDAYGPLAL